MPSGRRREIDTAKGIGILLVVLCHSIKQIEWKDKRSARLSGMSFYGDIHYSCAYFNHRKKGAPTLRR